MLSGVVIVALTAAMLGCLTWLVERKGGYEKKTFLYEQKIDPDVLFLGSSHMVGAVYPTDLWRNYGLETYNGGVVGAYLPTSYWVLKNTLDYLTPKLVVIDCFRLSSPKRACDTTQQIHVYLDTLPLSRNKIRMIWDVIGADEDRPEYLWDFIAYHDRWNEIRMYDFHPIYNSWMGAAYWSEIVELEEQKKIDPSQMLEEDTVGVQYLRKIIEECKRQNIEVLLVYIPFPADEKHQMEANRAAEIAKEYDLNYLNFLNMDIIDSDIDCRDAAYHLNVSGADKITDYLGKYIIEHYGISDRRGDTDPTIWEEEYTDFLQYKISVLSSQTDFKNYLMLLHDKNLSSCVYLSENALWHGDSAYDKLLANMGVDSDRLIAGGPTLAVVDNERNEVEYLACGESAETSFGTVSFALMDGAPKVLVNGAVSMEPAGNAAAAAMVIDDDTGRMVTSSQFAITTTAASVTKIS